MRTLTYTGPATRRILGPTEGLDTRRVFTRGEPLEVSDADARRILEGPAAGEFDAGPEPDHDQAPTGANDDAEEA